MEKQILLRMEFTSIHILAFSNTSLIIVTIKALIIPFCQGAVKIIFITNTSFISECVSVMIIRAATPRSHSKSVLWVFREALIALGSPVQINQANNVLKKKFHITLNKIT